MNKPEKVNRPAPRRFGSRGDEFSWPGLVSAQPLSLGKAGIGYLARAGESLPLLKTLQQPLFSLA